MASRVRIRARGLAAIMSSYKVRQSNTSKQNDVKPAKGKTSASKSYDKDKA